MQLAAAKYINSQWTSRVPLAAFTSGTARSRRIKAGDIEPQLSDRGSRSTAAAILADLIIGRLDRWQVDRAAN